MELRIKEIIKSKGMTMQEFSDILGIARVNLTKTINGNPTIETLERIAVALDVPIIELFEQNSGFTALIDNGGTLYRANSIGELKQLILQFEQTK